MEQRSISVVICTYNNANLLDRTLAALEKQQVDETLDWSVLVVDNNSTDGTLHVVQRYSERGLIPGLASVRETQQGLGFARRRAIVETKGALIAFVDDDCLVAANWVQQAMVFAEAHPLVGAFGGQVQLVWDVKPSDVAIRAGGLLAAQQLGDNPLQLPATGFTYLVGAGLVVRRTAIESSGWTEHFALIDRRGRSLSSGGDVEMVLRIRNAGYELWYNSAMQLEHFIPRERATLLYLCHVSRGTSHSTFLLSTLAENKAPTTRDRFVELVKCVKILTRSLLGLIIRDMIVKRRIPPDRWITIYSSLGLLEAAFRALPGDTKIYVGPVR